MGDTYVTFHGWVGNEVTHRDVNGVTVANLRVASTPRIVVRRPRPSDARFGAWIPPTASAVFASVSDPSCSMSETCESRPEVSSF